MTPSRLRLIALLALAVPIVVTAIAAGSNAAFGALALAAAAAVLAMLLAGPAFRAILAVLIALLGACVVAVAVFLPELDALTVVAIVGGALQVLVAAWVATTIRSWPATGARYSRSRVEGERASDDPARSWDALSAGDDPTDPAGVE
ncbi:Trp biosynthesis-associated membrane protein [Pseudolysinimonas yzui]|uniref:Uncharacterized protein n=1 Tax=Pseudolysinimonas yzui TaxID=2708254 RepID=A0A8J3GP33_9MICO|nr:Trp biosynthesis-associated membrane protein [Pseudolysinimonas yzui]GHF09022.1 hypothetical protein GCM10011600_07470 [Pseudolysinimonas yzui]